MNMACLLQVLLMASVRQIICHTLLTLSTLEERPEGIKIGTLSTAYSPPYQLLGSSYLRVNEETGDVYTTEQMIDRETLCPSQDGGYCTISAVALVGPEKELMKITIIVEDINDNAPYFETNEIRLRIPEDASVGTRVLLDDKALDKDIGSNAEIRYHLEGAEGFFSVAQDSSALELIVERELDRETQNEHCMVLAAVDSGSVPLSAMVSFVVAVLDVDDQCPQFSPDNPHTVSVPGGATRGTTVAQVQAIDPDLGSNSQITYSFSVQISDRAKELFHLDRNTGRISIAMDMRLDSLEEHVLKVVANSPPCPVEQTQVTVYLQPVLSPEPAVEIKYVAQYRNQTIILRENEPPTLLALLELRDISSVQRVLSLEEDSSAFTLKAQAGNYLLSTSKPLDFELCSKYLVTVVISEAQGKRVHARKEIKVVVEDVNDNTPQFEKTSYQVEIEENNKPGIPLVQVIASDADSELYGKVSYRLIHNTPAIFSIDEVTGVVSVLKLLDREQQGEYILTVLARDNGSPPLEAFSSVSIKVLDQNDNQPTFVTPRFIFFISEGTPHLAQVGKIGIVDADEGDNGKVVDVQVLDKHVPFAMDLSQSALRCTGEVDREKHEHYELLLLAIDGGSPQRSSTASVTVFVEDVNDNQPQVLLPSSNLSCLTIPPNTRAGSIITKIYAIDRDSGMNSDITYHIIAREPINPSPFQIDPHSGNITLVQQLVGRDYGMHHLLIRVSDRGKPAPLQATVWVNVLVNEISKQCHLTTVPPYFPAASEPPLPPKPYNLTESCTELPWLLLLCGLGMMVFSVCMFLGTVIICMKQKNLTRKRTRKRDHTKEHELKHLN
ncbi:protocadherin-20 isoform X2 [Pangasianodon hypophthalmus]|uniref:protocadherin-20 isoform X2 n=1 Tax=Pangasianodon hypophthalmus TaxID=310915 RepID=UPI000EFE4A75|nr:protocadherin-20 isoform X2 [Pangasianodon hypophthalmus]